MRVVVAINNRCTSSYCSRRRTINRDGRPPMVRSIVASCDRSYEQPWHSACDPSPEHSWHPVTECTINCGIRRPIVDQSWGATIDCTIVESCDRSFRPTTDRTINRGNRGTKRPIVRSIVASCDRSYDQSCEYRSAIMPPGTIGGTITQDLSASAYDLEWQVRRFEHDHRPCYD